MPTQHCSPLRVIPVKQQLHARRGRGPTDSHAAIERRGVLVYGHAQRKRVGLRQRLYDRRDGKEVMVSACVRACVRV
jgi:hypothetical protein